MQFTLHSTPKEQHRQLNVQINFYLYFQLFCFISPIDEIFSFSLFKFNLKEPDES